MFDREWSSEWKPAFDAVVRDDPTPAAAVTATIDFADAKELTTPAIYTSTAITSAGHRRDPELQEPSRIRDAITRNNRSAGLIMGALAEHQPGFITSATVMVPTELGKVPSWHDTDYLQFYFAWLAGLSSQAAAWYGESLSDPAYRQILADANARELPNDERWPAYRIFTEIALSKLAEVGRRPGATTRGQAELLLQLVDVGESLGCRAERLFADTRDLDIVAPTFGDGLGDALGGDIAHLQSIGATIGERRKPTQLVPVVLR